MAAGASSAPPHAEVMALYRMYSEEEPPPIEPLQHSKVGFKGNGGADHCGYRMNLRRQSALSCGYCKGRSEGAV